MTRTGEKFGSKMGEWSHLEGLLRDAYGYQAPSEKELRRRARNKRGFGWEGDGTFAFPGESMKEPRRRERL